MTNPRNILQFVTSLKENNNRDWFNENKVWYNQARADFEEITQTLINEISEFDAEIRGATVKESLFRIYRDIRFSHDKTPYKSYFGAYIAAHGGRKSPRSGYYLHIEPGTAFASVGVWMPEANVLKALRQSVYDNIDELNEIREEKNFAHYFKSFMEEDMLKTVPRGFPKDFPQADLLKLKHYIVSYPLDTKMLQSDNFVSDLVKVFKAGYPLNRFLNYTIDEVLDIDSRLR